MGGGSEVFIMLGGEQALHGSAVFAKALEDTWWYVCQDFVIHK